MVAHRFLIALLMWLAVAGCRGGGGAQTALVEQELRTQEDRIYQLQEYIEKYQAMLESSRRENEALKRELGTQGEVDSPPSGAERTPRRAAPRRSGVDAPPAGNDFRPPVIELGEPTGNEGGTPTPMPEDDGSLPLPFGNPGPEDSSSVLDSGPVSKLVLNPRLTGGLNMDGQPGDEGVMVVIEPRTASGELTKPIGDISIMVIDPTQDGAEARIARWDFTSDEAQQSWRKTIVGQGMQFELPWPDSAPRSDQLRLYARLVTPEGEKFIVEKDIEIDVPGMPSRKRSMSQWIPSKRASDVASHTAKVAPEKVPTKPTKRVGSQWQLRPLEERTVSAERQERAERQVTALEPADESPAAESNAQPQRGAATKKAANKRPAWQPYR